MSLFAIKSVLILDNQGKRICAKYFTKDFGDTTKQQAYEKELFGKTKRGNGEIIHFEKSITVFAKYTDVFFYVTGPPEENELILSEVLNCFVKTMTSFTKGSLDKRTVLDHLDLVYLTLDEMFDDGIIVESSSSVVAERVKSYISTDVKTMQDLYETGRVQVSKWIQQQQGGERGDGY